jgi:hypothetical protein
MSNISGDHNTMESNVVLLKKSKTGFTEKEDSLILDAYLEYKNSESAKKESSKNKNGVDVNGLVNFIHSKYLPQ